MKFNNALKSVIAAVLITSAFFLTLEIIQRVRWYFKSNRNTYWLLYGFVRRPIGYGIEIGRLAEKKKLGNKPEQGRLYEIQIFEKEYPGGLKKHNPDYPDYKGQVNSLGYRCHEFNPKKEDGIYRIVGIGGSTTAGYESDVDHTWPALLEKKLNNGIKGTKRFEVINAGKGEEGMDYVLTLLDKELVLYEPDMVIVYLTFNHLHLNRGCVNPPESFYYKMYKFKRWLSTHSLFFLTLREKLTILFHLGGQTCGDLYVPANNSKTLAEAFLNTPEIFKSYKERLESFISLCEEHNIIPVLATEACKLGGKDYMLLGKDMDVVYRKMYKVMEDVAKEKKTIFIDAARSMSEIPDNQRLFTDGLHLKPEGNDALAEIICKNLEPLLKEETKPQALQ